GFMSLFLASIGLALVLRQSLLLAYGPQPQTYRVNPFKVYVLGSVRLSEAQAITILAAGAIIVALGLFLARTTLGRTMRALADDRVLAAVAGIDVGRAIAFTWVLSGLLAGIAGVLAGLAQSSFDPNFGFTLLLPVFAAVVLGGIGSAYGALAGGLTLGIQLEFGITGLLNFGHVAFMAIGAYTMAILVVKHHVSMWVAAPVAVVVAGAAGLLLGLPSIRLRADYFAIVTIAFSEIVRYVATNEQSLTGGSQGTIALGSDCSLDRKSTRLNSSHSQISYAVFCLKKKNREPACSIRRMRSVDSTTKNTLSRTHTSSPRRATPKMVELTCWECEMLGSLELQLSRTP